MAPPVALSNRCRSHLHILTVMMMNYERIQSWAKRATPADLAHGGYDDLQILALDMTHCSTRGNHEG